MNCKDANKKISLLVDGLLNKNDERLLKEHINICNDCKAFFRDMQNAISRLSDLSEVALPDGFENRMHFALKHEENAPKKKSWFKVTAIAMPAVVAVFAAIIGFNYIFTGGMKNETAKENMMTMEAAPKASVMQKREVENEETAQDAAFGEAQKAEETKAMESRALEDTIEAEEMRFIAEFSVNVSLQGNSVPEMQVLAQEILLSLDDTYDDAIISDDEIQSMTALIPIRYYDEFMRIVEESDAVFSSETIDMQDSAYDEGLLFEVTFLFQTK